MNTKKRLSRLSQVYFIEGIILVSGVLLKGLSLIFLIRSCTLNNDLQEQQSFISLALITALLTLLLVLFLAIILVVIPEKVPIFGSKENITGTLRKEADKRLMESLSGTCLTYLSVLLSVQSILILLLLL